MDDADRKVEGRHAKTLRPHAFMSIRKGQHHGIERPCVAEAYEYGIDDVIDIKYVCLGGSV